MVKAEKSVIQLKRDLDKVFSRYIRLRDCSRHFDSNTYWVGTCITCSKTGNVAYIDEFGKLRFTKGWDAGHYVGRGHYITRYDELNVNLQCAMRCNRMKSGELDKYKIALDKKYGDGTAESLEALKSKTKKFKAWELIEMIEDYSFQIKEFEAGIA